MKNHLSTFLLAALGIVVSITLLLSLLYSDLRNRENLTTKIKEVEQTEAKEQK